MNNDCFVFQLSVSVSDPSLPKLGDLEFQFSRSGEENSVVIQCPSSKSITVKVQKGSFSASGSSGLTELTFSGTKTITFTSEVNEFVIGNYYDVTQLRGDYLVIKNEVKYMSGLTALTGSSYNLTTDEIPRVVSDLRGNKLGSDNVLLSGNVEDLPYTLNTVQLYGGLAASVTGSLNDYLTARALVNNNKFTRDFGIVGADISGTIQKLAEYYDVRNSSSSRCIWYLLGTNISGAVEDIASYYASDGVVDKSLKIYCNSTSITKSGASVGSSQYIQINWDDSGNITYEQG